MRQRIARLGSSRQQTPALDPLFRIIRDNHPKADLGLVERAYRKAERLHNGQMRKSGDAFITHPLAVTTILAELGMTEATLCASLLHDTVEDTDYTLKQLTREFGEEIALLVDGCTKLDKVKYGESAKSETIRKMVVAMSRDIRVLVIKLADRLHNMRTLHYLRPDKQSRIAAETLEIFAPLAHRLGMNTIKWELEDLSFGTLYPKVYDEIVRLVAEAAPSRDEYLSHVIDQVQGDLRAAKIKAVVTGRLKHYYSITKRWWCAAETSRTSTTWWDCGYWSRAIATVMQRSVYCMSAGTRCRAGSRTTSRCRSSTCTSPCTPRFWDQRASQSSCRFGPTICIVGLNTA